MEIANILKRLDDSQRVEQSVKTASAQTAADKTQPTALRDALRDSLAAADTTKTAAAQQPAPEAVTPVGDLLKMASDLMGAEEEGMQKQAQVYGAAICDGFMTRLAQYEDAAGQVAPPVQQPQQTKVATTNDQALEMIKSAAAQDVEFHKFANANPDLVKEAFDLGYRQTMEHLVKQANDEFAQGHDETMQQVHKIASAAYIEGAQTIDNILRQAQAA